MASPKKIEARPPSRRRRGAAHAHRTGGATALVVLCLASAPRRCTPFVAPSAAIHAGARHPAVSPHDEFAAPRADARTVRLSTPTPGGPMTPEQMQMAAQAMKNLDAAQIGKMLEEMEKMGPAEKEQMRKMGTNPDMLMMSMRLLKANPGALEMAKKQMEKMSPEQMAEASKAAQEQMQNMSPEQLEFMASQANAATPTIDVPIAAPADAASARDPALVDAFFKAGEFSTNPPTGGVDLRSFKALPPIAALRGDLPDDLSDDEIEQVWAEQAAGAARVDRAGFEKVWLAIDDLYDDDLMVEARRPPKKTRAPAADDAADDA